MIRTVSGGKISGEEVRFVSFEHILCDVAHLPLEWVPAGSRCCVCVSSSSVSALSSVEALRVDPCSCPANLRLDSEEVAARELNRLVACAQDGVALVCDFTTPDENADPAGLARIAKRLDKKVHILRAAGVKRSEIVDAHQVATALRKSLLADDSATPASFISIEVDAAFDSIDETLLKGAREASNGTFLVVVTLPAFESENGILIEKVAATLQKNTPTLLRCATRTNLQQDGSIVLVDGFGRPFEAAFWPSGCDEIDDLKRLMNALTDDNCLLSVGIRHKNQLVTYGGFGYDYAARLLATRAILDPEKNDVFLLRQRRLLANPHVIKALAVYQAPKVRPIPIPSIRCTLCGAAFPRPKRAGFYYAKYDFVYCTRACLDRHRSLQFKTTDNLLKGPLASMQEL